MRHDFYHPGRSREVRGDWPEGEGEAAHPRAVEMAEKVLDLLALGQGVGFKDLTGAGFSVAEIVEHHDAADRIVKEREVRQITVRPDLVADIIAKARRPVPNDPPLTRDMHETQALFVLWSNYCSARQALVIDPWTGQRERAMAKLSAYLDRMPIFRKVKDDILAAVSAHLPKVPA